MPTPTLIEKINTAMDAAVTAQESGDFKTALTKARTAWMLISSLPNSMFDNEQLQWQPESINNVIQHLQRMANSAASSDGTGGIIRPVPVVYTREDSYRE